ncbi:MAG TPA: MFS transporter, partial [Spirochaetia bacterium]|nr:MFS transporter [Spirochaetia bacterium]
PAVGVLIIIIVNGMRSFTGNFSNPAWTAMAADLVPVEARGRYFGVRNTMMGIAALVTAPLAGWVVETGNRSAGMPYLGFQLLFVLALVTGLASTFCFNRIPEPSGLPLERRTHRKGDLRRTLRTNRAFVGLVLSAFVWNLALQIGGPFFNVYFVTALHGNNGTVGAATGIANLTNLIGLFVFARLIDRKGNKWVIRATGFVIPLLPLSWVYMTSVWQVYLNNVFSGFLWAGYNMANFNLLLELTPSEQRPRAVALYQTVVFAAAVITPALGGYLADAIGLKPVFAMSSIGRYLAMFIFVLLVR